VGTPPGDEPPRPIEGISPPADHRVERPRVDGVRASERSGAHGRMAASTEELPPDLAQRRKFRLGLGLALALLLLALIATATYRYVNRPTPQKTLDSFCSALQNENYQEAYNQFTPTLQGQFSERDFSQVLARDKVVTCTHGAVSDSGNMISTTLKLVHQSRGVNSDMVFLTKDSQDAWKINDLQRMS
jgi:hypothetical protein